jgi:hypothetical protein
MQHYHPHARLTTHGRVRLLHAVASGTPVADAYADAGVSRTTYSHWRQRFASEGLPGLADRSSRPRCPRMALTPAQVQAIWTCTHLSDSHGFGSGRGRRLGGFEGDGAEVAVTVHGGQLGTRNW